MSKAIKFRNGLYLDSRSIVHGRIDLYSILVNSIQPIVTVCTSDNQTVQVKVNENSINLLYNGHVNNPCMYMVMVHKRYKTINKCTS